MEFDDSKLASWNVLDMTDEEVDESLSSWVDPDDIETILAFLSSQSSVSQPSNSATAWPSIDGMQTDEDEDEADLSRWLDPAEVNALIAKLPLMTFGFGRTSAAECGSDMGSGRLSFHSNPAYLTSFKNPIFGQEQRTPGPFVDDSDSDSDSDFDFCACSLCYCGITGNACTGSGAHSSCSASTPAFSSPSWSSSSSPSRVIPALQDLALDLGYASLDDEAIFRADMRDLETFGLIGATTDQLLEAAVERSFGCADRR